MWCVVIAVEEVLPLEDIPDLSCQVRSNGEHTMMPTFQMSHGITPSHVEHDFWPYIHTSAERRDFSPRHQGPRHQSHPEQRCRALGASPNCRDREIRDPVDIFSRRGCFELSLSRSFKELLVY